MKTVLKDELYAREVAPIPILGSLGENMVEPAVLVADADPDSSQTYARFLGELGYRCSTVSNAGDALDRLAEDSAIQILFADVALPTMGGLALIDQARLRRADDRPLAPILLANDVTADIALAGIRHDIVDLLPKAHTADSCSAALHRAIRHLRAHSDSENAVSQQLSRIVGLLEGKREEPLLDFGPTVQEVNATLNTIIAARTLRARHLPGALFADPVWDILLDLTRAELAGAHVSVSSACIAASVPMSTALRVIKQMTEAGLLKRWTDPKDRRRDLICLSEAASANMKRYLASAHGMFRKVAMAA